MAQGWAGQSIANTLHTRHRCPPVGAWPLPWLLLAQRGLQIRGSVRHTLRKADGDASPTP